MDNTTFHSTPVALVTGGARGIGNAIAWQLKKDGYQVAVLDMPAPDQVTETLEGLDYIQGDITRDESRKNAVDILFQKYGRIDVLVNNAGVAPRTRKDILETTEESFDFVTGVNLKGTFFLTQRVASLMIGSMGKIPGYQPKIVNISSMSAYTSSTNRGEYCISKAGISMVTALFADRLAEAGILVYEVRPGIIATDMTAGVKEKYDRLFEQGITPLRRWGQPEDIARAVSVLCSGMLSYSTGEVINVDGGFHLRRL